MGTNIPTTIPAFIDWCTSHAPLWASNSTLIGVSSAQATAFTTLVTNLNKAAGTADTARDASKSATLLLGNAIDAAHASAALLVSTIKNYAESTHNMDVYGLAAISPANPPSPAATPVAPTKFGATINPDGTLTVNWKVAQPTGIFGVNYLVSRRLNGSDGPFTFVGSEGANKSFTDTTLPVGVDKVEYIVQPKRGMDFGPQSDVFSVQFGSVGGGMSITDFSATPHAEPMKIAA